MQYEEVDEDEDNFGHESSSSGLSLRKSENLILKTKLEMTEFQYQETLSKLESANCQIGYLQAQLENSQGQMIMLTKRRRGFWQRICAILKVPVC